MDASLARGYATQLINQMPSDEEFSAAIKRGMDKRVYDQFHKIAYTKKPDDIARKMRRASEGRMRIRIPNWTRNRKTVVLETITGVINQPAHSYFIPEKIRWRESALIMQTIFCERQYDRLTMYRMNRPSICKHAIIRLLHRNAATPDTLKEICQAALNRTREAVSLLQQEDNVYDLLLPFADGALAIQVHGGRMDDSERPMPPSLSVRTYLSDAMLDESKAERIYDLQEFYLEQNLSDTERYRELLLKNRRFHNHNRGCEDPNDALPDLNECLSEECSAR